MDQKKENNIIYSLNEILEDRFARYAKYIIQDRALPDIRDGLKPVQRRILFAMNELKLFHSTAYKKAARIVGEVIGKYHPHGDTSVYDAMVRMSQSWKMRYPLVDMHGNNGSLDGDSAAAMRYTEARLSKISTYLLKDLEKKTVEFIANFDDSETEPSVLPASLPNLLINGSTGIAAGYATNIPPHNLTELIKTIIKRIKNPNSNLESLMKVIQGPDFPTGGIIQGTDGIKEAFMTGKGKVILRSKIEVDSDKNLVITEIPYEVVKQDLVKKIDDVCYLEPGLNVKTVRDETDRNGLRIVIETGKNANVDVIRKYLLKHTNLQISYNYNMVGIANKSPILFNLIDYVDNYISHQQKVIINRTKFELAKAEKRLEIVAGLIKAISILDEIIKIIRQSENKANAIQNLQTRFDFTFVQAEAIVLLRLYRLTSTDILDLQNETKDLENKINELKLILKDKNVLNQVIIDQLQEIMNKHKSIRRTIIENDIENIDIDITETIPEKNVNILVSREGYLKVLEENKNVKFNIEDVKKKSEDSYIANISASTLDTLLIVTSKGNYVIIPIFKIKQSKIREIGVHINTISQISGDEKVVSTFLINDIENSSHKIAFFSKFGFFKATNVAEFAAKRISKAIKCINLQDHDEVISAKLIKNEKLISIITEQGFVVKYKIDEIPLLGLRTKGIKAINLKDDFVVGAFLYNPKDKAYIFTSKYKHGIYNLDKFEFHKRPVKGSRIINFKANDNDKIIGAFSSNYGFIVKYVYTNNEIEEYDFINCESKNNIKPANVIDTLENIVQDSFFNILEKSGAKKPKPPTNNNGNNKVSNTTKTASTDANKSKNVRPNKELKKEEDLTIIHQLDDEKKPLKKNEDTKSAIINFEKVDKTIILDDFQPNIDHEIIYDNNSDIEVSPFLKENSEFFEKEFSETNFMDNILNKNMFLNEVKKPKKAKKTNAKKPAEKKLGKKQIDLDNDFKNKILIEDEDQIINVNRLSFDDNEDNILEENNEIVSNEIINEPENKQSEISTQQKKVVNKTLFNYDELKKVIEDLENNSSSNLNSDELIEEEEKIEVQTEQKNDLLSESQEYIQEPVKEKEIFAAQAEQYDVEEEVLSTEPDIEQVIDEQNIVEIQKEQNIVEEEVLSTEPDIEQVIDEKNIVEIQKEQNIVEEEVLSTEPDIEQVIDEQNIVEIQKEQNIVEEEVLSTEPDIEQVIDEQNIVEIQKEQNIVEEEVLSTEPEVIEAHEEQNDVQEEQNDFEEEVLSTEPEVIEPQEEQNNVEDEVLSTEPEVNLKNVEKKDINLHDFNEENINELDELINNVSDENNFVENEKEKTWNAEIEKFDNKNDNFEHLEFTNIISFIKDDEKEQFKLEDEEQFKLEDEEQFKLEDEEQFKLEDEEQFKLEDEEQFKLEDEEQFKLEDEEQFKLEDEEQFKLEDEEQFKLEDEEQFKLEDEEQFKLEDEEQFKLEDEEQFKLEDEEQFKLEDEEQFKLEDEEQKQNDFDFFETNNEDHNVIEDGEITKNTTRFNFDEIENGNKDVVLDNNLTFDYNREGYSFNNNSVYGKKFVDNISDPNKLKDNQKINDNKIFNNIKAKAKSDRIKQLERLEKTYYIDSDKNINEKQNINSKNDIFIKSEKITTEDLLKSKTYLVEPVTTIDKLVKEPKRVELQQSTFSNKTSKSNLDEKRRKQLERIEGLSKGNNNENDNEQIDDFTINNTSDF